MADPAYAASDDGLLALLLPHLGHTLTAACYLIGLLMELGGGLLIGLSLLGGGSAMGLIRGGALLVFGVWFAGLAG